jgi:thymidine phosphorylase
MVRPVEPLETGIVGSIDVRAVGLAVIGLGGGRARETDLVDHAVGLTEIAGLGERVGPGERPLALVHARSEDDAARAGEAVRAAFSLGEVSPEVAGPVIEAQRTV